MHRAAAAGLRRRAEAIGRSGNVEAIRQAIGLLLPPPRIVDGTVRRERARALAVLVRNIRGAGPLLAVLESEQVRAAVAWALDEVSDQGARETLAAWGALRDLATHDPNTRRRAADRLGKLGDARAVEPLVAALDDENGGVRVAAALALGELGDVGAAEPLAALAADARQEEYVRRAARAALQRVGGSRTEELRQLGEGRAVKVLAAALAGGDRRARMAAAEALGRLGLGEAVEPLLVALADRDWRVREAVARALGRLGDARAAETLGALADDRWERKPVRDAARAALEQIGRRS